MAARATRTAAAAPAPTSRSAQWRQHARTTVTIARHTTTVGRTHAGHLGPQLAPHAAMGALVLAAAATRTAMAHTGADAQIALGVAGTALVVAVVAASVTRRRFADRRTRNRMIAFIAVAAGWLTTVTATGMNLTAVAILYALGVALNLHWWRAHRIPNTSAVAQQVAVPDADVYAELWAARLGGDGCELAGSKLTDPKRIDSGIRYTLALVPGRQTMSAVMGMAEKIEGALHLMPDQEFIVERHPTKSAAFLQVTVVTKSPIRQSVLWPGPAAFNAATGRVDLGPYADGEGTANWRVYTENSLWGGFIAGDPGSGKSRMFDSLAMSIAGAQAHPTVVWFADGDEGASSPMLNAHADHKAVDPELEQAQGMFAGALLIMQVRRAENAVNGWSGFTPTSERPGLLIFVDECHVLFADKALRLMAAEIVSRGRKVGVNMIAASQIATLDTFGGAGVDKSDRLRMGLIAGNAVCLKSSTANTKEVFGVTFDPRKFPALPGYGYRIAGKGDTTVRTAPMRGYFVNDDAIAVWPKRIVWRALPEGEGNAYGPDYVKRREAAAEFQAEQLAWIEAMKAGRGSLRQPARPTGGDGATASTAGLVVINWPTWQSPEPSGPALAERHQRVLAAMQAGQLTPKLIQDATGYSEAWVHRTLGELRDEHGLIRSAPEKYGQYELLREVA